MARGWESKSVEEQQSQATSTSPELKQPLSPEQIVSRQHHEGLALSRKRVLQQLETAQNPRHRKMLEDSLADLDAQLSRRG
jgi:hypothetical protein